jgi:nucleotide-binding universal stress UspA family protein
MPEHSGCAREPRTVVVGYDGSQTSRRGVARAAEEAGAGGRVLVVTAVPPGDLPSDDDQAIGDPARLLEEAAALVGGRVDVSTQVGDGDPVDVLVAAAETADAQLIVVGARGGSFVARALRGSVGERLVSRAPCDLLVAH